MMELVYSSETLVCIYKSTQRYKPADQRQHVYCNEDLKYRIFPWRKFNLEKLIAAQLVEKLPTFMEP